MYKELKELLNELYKTDSKTLYYLHVIIEDLNTENIFIKTSIAEIEKNIENKEEKEKALKVCSLLLDVKDQERKDLLLKYNTERGNYER